jgi:MFS family permease
VLDGGGERVRRFEHRVVADVGEAHDRCLGTGFVQSLDHRPHRDGIGVAPDDRERGGVALDRSRPAALVIATLVDVPDQTRQQQVAAVVEDEVRRRLDVLLRHVGSGRERAAQGLDQRVAPQSFGKSFVGEPEQQLLAVGELGHVDVDGAVGEDAPAHLEGERPIEAARQDLPANGVTHVVGDQYDLVEPQVADDRRDQIGLLEEGVVLVGLIGEPVPEQVEQHDAAAAREAVQDAVPIVRRGRETVEDEDGSKYRAIGFRRCAVDDEHALTGHVAVLAALFPRTDTVIDRGHGVIVSCAAVPLITAQSRKWWVVVAMSGVMILLTVDFFGITVALPRIGDDLDASTTTLLWTVNAYLLAFVSPMIAIGRFADIFGRRKVALIGIVLFVGASAACAGAPTDLFLIAARIVQGVGGGIISTVSVSIVNNAFPPDERAKPLGIWSGVGLAGSALGPFLAGVLTEFASWRWFFFLNVPIGITTFVITVAVVEESRDPTFTGGIDWAGFATLTVGFVLLILGLQQSGNEGWTAPVVLGPILFGAVSSGCSSSTSSRCSGVPPWCSSRCSVTCGSRARPSWRFSGTGCSA